MDHREMHNIMQMLLLLLALKQLAALATAAGGFDDMGQGGLQSENSELGVLGA
eukprot:SAG11_NODE_24282_length_375_cov_1.721014_2_plen_53_part_00